jgi:hypothetical protein
MLPEFIVAFVKYYLCFCLFVFAVVVGIGIYEDVTGKYDRKFGPNMKSKMFWFMVLLFSTPLHFLILGGIALRAIKERK